MFLILQITTVVAFIMLVFVHKNLRPHKEVSVVDYFMFFFSITFGPHLILLPYLSEWGPSMWRYSSNAGHVTLYLILIITYCGLCIGMVVGRTIFPVPRISFSSRGKTRQKVYYSLFYLVTVLYLVGFILSDPATLIEKITTYVSYTLSQADFSYSHIRRELFADTRLFKIEAATRYTISASFFACVVGIAAYERDNYIKAAPLCAALFLLCAISFNKLTLVYYLLLIMMVSFHVNRALNKWSLNNIKIPTSVLRILFLAVWAFSMMVYFQYKDSLYELTNVFKRILALTVYRPFFAAGDILALYADVYPERLPYTYFSNIGLFSKIFGFDLRIPDIEVRNAIIGEYPTTFPAGFIGSSYASFGYAGVFVISILVGIIVQYLLFFSYRMRNHCLKAAFNAASGMSTFFLSAISFHTAILSGGVLSTPIIFSVLKRLIKYKNLNHVEYNSDCKLPDNKRSRAAFRRKSNHSSPYS